MAGLMVKIFVIVEFIQRGGKTKIYGYKLWYYNNQNTWKNWLHTQSPTFEKIMYWLYWTIFIPGATLERWPVGANKKLGYYISCDGVNEILMTISSTIEKFFNRNNTNFDSSYSLFPALSSLVFIKLLICSAKVVLCVTYLLADLWLSQSLAWEIHCPRFCKITVSVRSLNLLISAPRKTEIIFKIIFLLVSYVGILFLIY